MIYKAGILSTMGASWYAWESMGMAAMPHGGNAAEEVTQLQS
jgi:hypothetical protein